MEKIIGEGLAAMGIDAPAGAASLMAAYGRRLLETNKVTNLTAITEPAAVARLHFLDSAALASVADLSGRTVADVGSGAGFPGIPLRILRPDMRLTVIDSAGKKIDFVRETCAALGIEGVTCLWGRAEEMAECRENFDVAVSRAVADLPVLSELCLPLVKVGGLFLAMKGPDCEEEVSRADPALRTLGGALREIRRCPIPGTEVTHAVVVVEKVRPTPPRYPRRYAQMKKKPLCG